MPDISKPNQPLAIRYMQQQQTKLLYLVVVLAGPAAGSVLSVDNVGPLDVL